MALFDQSMATLVMAESACASLIITSYTDVPLVACVYSKYLNCSPSSSTFPFIRILVGGLGLMLPMRNLPLLELISNPDPADIFSSF